MLVLETLITTLIEKRNKLVEFSESHRNLGEKFYYILFVSMILAQYISNTMLYTLMPNDSLIYVVMDIIACLAVIKTVLFDRYNDLKELFKLLNIYYKKTMKMITFDYYGRKTSIFLKDIHYITSFGHDISIVCDQETYTYRSSLKDALKLIDSPVVVQVHRSYAVSMMYIKEVDKNNIILKDETCITLGKKYVDEFMFQYREYLIS